jgi:hypothetical protein
MKPARYPWKFITKRTALLAAILFFGTLLRAQETTDSATTVPQIEIADDADEPDDTERNNYFLPKWMTETEADSLMLRRLDKDHVDSLRNEDDFWYANAVFKKKKKDSPKSRNNGWEALLWIVVIGGFIAFLFIYLTNSNVMLFRKTRHIRIQEDDIPTDNIFEINYQKEIDKAVAAGNYRLATRLFFLRLLKTLSDKHYIKYKHDSTNFDYLMQLNQQPWYQHFFRLTRNYEYIWYGQFDISREDFDDLKKDFIKLEEKL